LSERRGDIWPLVCAMLERYRYIGSIAGIDADAAEALLTYPWPGNVRELENAIQRALIVADGQCLTVAHLGLDGYSERSARDAVETTQSIEAVTPDSALNSANSGPGEMQSDTSSQVPHQSYRLAVRRDSAEAEVILTMLKETPTKAAAAAKLGISERTLRYKLARYRESGLLAVNS